MQHSPDCHKLLDEVESRLLARARHVAPEKAAERAHFMKTTMPLLGLSVPEQRACLKEGYRISSLPFIEQLPCWSHVWFHARSHEAKLQAALFVEKPSVSADPSLLWNHIAPWVSRVNCWDQSDCLSRVYSLLLERIPDQVLPTLTIWNESTNPWERRQSLVALLFYSRFRRAYPDPSLLFRLVEARIKDPDYYVQKGLGWTLREAYLVWPQRSLDFLWHNICDLAPAAWQAATEKLPGDVKQALKARRKGGR